MSREQIESLIPHRAPMLLLDEVVEQGEAEIHCRKTFVENEFFFQGHYPDDPIVPGVILCESALQAGAVLLSTLVGNDPESANQVPVATRLNNVKFKKIVRPGDTIELLVKLDERLADAFFLTARVMINSSLAVRLEFACTMTSSPPA